MEEAIQKKRKSRWGESEKKNINNENDSNKPLNILEDLNLACNSNLINQTRTSQFPNNFNLSSLSSSIHLNILKATEAAKLAIEKVKRASRFKDDTKQKIKKVDFLPKPLKFDEQGREIDEEGNVINVKPVTYSTLKVNINKLEENNLLKKKNIPSNKCEDNFNEDFKWYDSRIKNVQKKKKKNAFNFITPGSIIKRETYSKNYNNKFQLGFDLKKIIQEKKKVQSFQELSLNFLNKDISSTINPNLIDINNKKLNQKKEWKDDERYDIMEKWDMALFKKIDNKENLKDYIIEQTSIWKNKLNTIECKKYGKYTNDDNIDENNKEEKKTINENEFSNNIYVKVNRLLNNLNILLLESNEIIIKDDLYKINMKKITSYIEHPIPLNDDKKASIITPNMYLTPIERKKLRKRKRQEKEKEKQDKIRIGLIPPPPPKMKLSNLMRVLGDSAVAHPSKIELEVREQMKERELRHYEQNQQRKLNPQEKSKKQINKWKCNPNEENEVLVIYITNLSNKKHIFKIDINAQQLHLTGVCFMTVLYNFIIVEGKHISIERYKRLIFRRIKWSENEDEEEEEGKENENKINDSFDHADNFENDMLNMNINHGCNCSLIWSGTVKKKNFLNWRMIVAKTESEVTDYLQEHDALHYYHIIKKHRDVLQDI
ncbi:U4/U6 small nuclear ribonucleoprotein PRP3, putative [Plasmodium gallinaceum]|uniref:U4/U6 small nuclear ribonucleoprotein PRP3, putative n=1 Tax=Plasmodium gallinaceum TaxID=5849 RepID=A0A1J1GZ20_PLAGA|nr:U4/U6 small nuclear ribonucleoprotein PRP3, putative [Plasmodium gallinaceum]CRG97481.1 U4/U6 small nuclear ribonucleoprotein PRP3, putative [Plasmodium gallinaceum]